ncbi:hypothetical protein [Nocardioides sp. LHG3406-4]|uniref:hypothetical protein n=1 Tax=Nocardioides sp. LHG3406-4 TaxID=2804575 RepID=UPI003CF29562
MSTDITTESTTSGSSTGRHPINVGHLVMGIAFLGLAGVWAAIEGDLIEGGDIRWLLPVPWVLGGAAGLLAIALGGRRRAAAAERPGYQAYAATYPTPYAAPYSTPYSSPAASPAAPAGEPEADTTSSHTAQDEEDSR